MDNHISSRVWNEITYPDRSWNCVYYVRKQGSIYWDGLTLTPAWISNYTNYKVSDTIFYPFQIDSKRGPCSWRQYNTVSWTDRYLLLRKCSCRYCFLDQYHFALREKGLNADRAVILRIRDWWLSAKLWFPSNVTSMGTTVSRYTNPWMDPTLEQCWVLTNSFG